MKAQNLFSRKNKNNISNCRRQTFAPLLKRVYIKLISLRVDPFSEGYSDKEQEDMKIVSLVKMVVNQPSIICCLRFIAFGEKGAGKSTKLMCCLRFKAVCENGGGKSPYRYLLLI